ncbi:MAG: MBL fold metallo-hydrolase [Bacteroidales bacterium]|nr:MBL fold metallo-hydrolase [Bacteroidales bacterium]
MKIKQFVFNHFAENTFVIIDEETSSCAIIDPGCFRNTERQELLSFLNENNLIPEKVLYTHCHIDHTFGSRFLAETFPNIKFYAHQAEQHFIDGAIEQGQMFGVTIEQPPSIGHYLFDGETISVGNIQFKVIHTPGHSLGCVCFYCEKEKIAFTGDTLFANCIGRTDFYGGSYESILNSLKDKLLLLPEDTKVLPGHGPYTTIREEKNTNPYIQ